LIDRFARALLSLGQELMMISGSSHDRKFTTISIYTSTMANTIPAPKPTKAASMLYTWPRTTIQLPR
jgi:hypothetical protein